MRFGLAAAVALTATAASAGPVYFHKPSVERDTFVGDFSECSELAGGVRVQRQYVYTPSLYAAAAASIFAGFFKSREERALMDNVMRTCMSAKGYVRVKASDAITAELKRLPDSERVDRLFALTAAPQPNGKVLPR
ncbi:MAG TPA: hypothetical protein VF727_12075 [Allosphingosinicella sp.]